MRMKYIIQDIAAKHLYVGNVTDGDFDKNIPPCVIYTLKNDALEFRDFSQAKEMINYIRGLYNGKCLQAPFLKVVKRKKIIDIS